jgi:hypothetical protein
MIDPKGEIRGHVEELQRLDSALAGLARHRGTVCSLAIDNGVYTREDVGALLKEHGINPAFLAVAKEAPPQVGTPETDATETVARLVKLGVLDAEHREKFAHAVGLDAVLSAEKEFDVGGEGDDLSVAMQQTETPASPKL